ncbi:MAG: hypothetical protein C0467_17580 [Planctomycetaceae bacterium]|nr:hypothetical protein [Planctomycetaceae bacterium]
MPMKPKLAALRREVAKLLAGAPRAGQGAGWVALWRLQDWTALVEESLPPDTPCRHYAATCFVLEKEAARFGIAGDPEFVAALDELREAMERAANPPDGATWQERDALQDAMREASVKPAMLVLDAMGVPPGPLGAHPPGGRPPRESAEFPAEWFREPAAEVAT